MKRLWLVCYDISDDRKRSRVHQQLRDVGQPLQYSVFACVLDRAARQRLQTELTANTEDSDSIRWYPQCAWCREQSIVLGNAQQTEATDYFIV